MSNHNYSQYFKTNNTDEAVFNPVKSSITEAEVKPDPVIEPVAPVVPAPQSNTAKGVVTNCAKLNVRLSPNSDAKVMCVINAKAEVVIDPYKSTDEWYRVCTVAGVKGYCMKQFIDADL